MIYGNRKKQTHCQLSDYGNKIMGRVNAKIKWKANVCKQTGIEKNEMSSLSFR